MNRFAKSIAVALLAIQLISCTKEVIPAVTTALTGAQTTEGDTTVHTTVTDPVTTPAVTTPTPPVTEPPPKEGIGRLSSLTMSAEDNPTLAETLHFVINEEAKTATLTLTYQSYADLATLSDAHLVGEAIDGTISFLSTEEADGVDLTAGAICRITDAEEGVRDYRLIVDRTVYQLPIVNITLADGKTADQIDRNETTPMTFSLDCTGAKDFESVGNVSGKIRGRGNSTWKWDKKPYKIKLDQKESLLGMDDNKDWILLANYADKSLIRNTLAYEMGRVLTNLVWSPHSYPVDLFVNGKYCGVYALGEHMEVANGRVELEEGSADPDTDYLLEIGGMQMTGDINGVHYFHTDGRLVRFATFKSPDAETITQAQKDFITGYFQKAEDAILAGEGYEDYIDVDSFIDWILLHELTNNIDSCFRRSCFLVKEKGGKIRMGPIWDFDLAFGNFSRDNKNYDNWITVGSSEEDAYVKYNWCTYLMRDPEFCKQLEARWREIRTPLLDRAEKTIAYYSALLDGSQQENFEVWKIWGVRAGYQSKQCYQANTYEKQIQYLRDFLKKRAAWMDSAMITLPR